MNKEYKLSGKSGNIILISPLLGPILLFVICFIYAYVSVYNPIIYLSILVFVGLLLGMLATLFLVVHVSKCRSVRSAIINGTVLGLFTIYLSWCTFLYAMLRHSDIPVKLFDLLLNPGQVLEWANTLSVKGYYSILDEPTAGGALWTIWFLEAFIILIAGILGGKFTLHEKIFCEKCHTWAKDTEINLLLEVTSTEEVKTMIESDVNKLLNLEKYENSGDTHLKVNIHQCEKCKHSSTLDVDLISYEIDPKGKVKENKEDFSLVYEISQSQLQHFQRKKQEPREATA